MQYSAVSIIQWTYNGTFGSCFLYVNCAAIKIKLIGYFCSKNQQTEFQYTHQLVC